MVVTLKAGARLSTKGVSKMTGFSTSNISRWYTTALERGFNPAQWSLSVKDEFFFRIRALDEKEDYEERCSKEPTGGLLQPGRKPGRNCLQRGYNAG